MGVKYVIYEDLLDPPGGCGQLLWIQLLAEAMVLEKKHPDRTPQLVAATYPKLGQFWLYWRRVIGHADGLTEAERFVSQYLAEERDFQYDGFHRVLSMEPTFTPASPGHSNSRLLLNIDVGALHARQVSPDDNGQAAGLRSHNDPQLLVESTDLQASSDTG